MWSWHSRLPDDVKFILWECLLPTWSTSISTRVPNFFWGFLKNCVSDKGFCPTGVTFCEDVWKGQLGYPGRPCQDSETGPWRLDENCHITPYNSPFTFNDCRVLGPSPVDTFSRKESFSYPPSPPSNTFSWRDGYLVRNESRCRESWSFRPSVGVGPGRSWRVIETEHPF